MANYVKATNFAVKDTLATGNPAKIVKGTEIDSELTAIASAVSSKADSESPTLTGTPLAPTATVATNNTQISTTAYVVNRIAQDIAGKANIASPAFTGTPTAPTPATIDSSTKLATTEYVVNKINAIAAGVTSFSTGTTGLTPSAVTTGAIVLSGTLAVANGGTGSGATYTNGQLLIGNSTGGTLTKATLTQGAGITITNGTGSISVANSGVLSVNGNTGALTINSASSDHLSVNSFAMFYYVTNDTTTTLAPGATVNGATYLRYMTTGSSSSMQIGRNGPGAPTTSPPPPYTAGTAPTGTWRYLGPFPMINSISSFSDDIFTYYFWIQPVGLFVRVS